MSSPLANFLAELNPAAGGAGRRRVLGGTTFGIKVDGQTIEDQIVTVRDRDSMEQVKEYLRGKMG